MDFKEIAERINSVVLNGQRYDRVLASRNFKLSWFEKHFKTFKHTEDTLAFPEHYMFSVIRKNQVIDVYDVPLSSICKQITLTISKEGIAVIPKCEACEKDLVLLTFIQRQIESYPIWYCENCSKVYQYQPCKLYYDSKLQLTETEKEHLKALLEEIRGYEGTENRILSEDEALDLELNDEDLDSQLEE